MCVRTCTCVCVCTCVCACACVCVCVCVCVSPLNLTPLPLTHTHTHRYAITLPLGVVHPDHPLHIVSCCTNCGFAEDAAWSTLGASGEKCVEDTILTTIGESFQGFVNNYMATLLGHICTVFALLNAQDGNISPKVGMKEKLHMLGYTIIIIDMIVEVMYLASVRNTDPNRLNLDEYPLCNATEIKEITSHKKDLLEFAEYVMIIRLSVAALVTIIYIIKAEVTADEHAAEKEEEDAKKLLSGTYDYFFMLGCLALSLSPSTHHTLTPCSLPHIHSQERALSPKQMPQMQKQIEQISNNTHMHR